MKFLFPVILVLRIAIAIEWVPHEIYQSEIKERMDHQGKKHKILNKYSIKIADSSDFNQDGQQDVVVLSWEGVRIIAGPEYQEVFWIYDNRKMKGEHWSPINTTFHGKLIDVDQDGDMDFVSESDYWLECPPNKPFTSKWKKHLITDKLKRIHCVRDHDIDLDGKKEIIVCDNNVRGEGEFNASIVVLKPNEDFSQPWSILPITKKGDAFGGARYFDVGDVNGDGLPDITQGHKGLNYPEGNYFAVWYQQKDPNQPWKKEKLPGEIIGASHAEPADVDGDGVMDIVATAGYGKGIFYYKGPDWKIVPIDMEYSRPHTLEIGDPDKDGDLDIALGAMGVKPRMSYFENDGSGKFKQRTLKSDQSVYDVRFKDMEGDGDLDILVAGFHNLNVLWFENKLY